MILFSAPISTFFSPTSWSRTWWKTPTPRNLLQVLENGWKWPIYIWFYLRESSEWFVSAFLKSELFWCFLPGCGFRVSLDFQLRTVYGGCSGLKKHVVFGTVQGLNELLKLRRSRSEGILKDFPFSRSCFSTLNVEGVLICINPPKRWCQNERMLWQLWMRGEHPKQVP